MKSRTRKNKLFFPELKWGHMTEQHNVTFLHVMVFKKNETVTEERNKSHAPLTNTRRAD